MGRGQVREKGFTLLELIVVLFILGLAAGVVVPAVARSTDTVRTRTNVVGLSALLRHTREQAIVLRKAHTVTIDVVEHAVKVGVADTIVRRRAIPANWSIEANPPNALTLRF